MTARFNLVAAVLGLAVATVAVGDATAKIAVHKTAIHKSTAHKALVHRAAIHAPHRIIVGKRFARHVHVVRRAPTVVKMVKTLVPTTIVRIEHPVLVKRPLLHKQVVAHRVTLRKTIIR